MSKSRYHNTSDMLGLLARAADAVSILLAGILGFFWKFGVAGFPMPPHYIALVLSGTLLALGVLNSTGAYRSSWRGAALPSIFGRALLGWTLTIAILLSTLFLLKVSHEFSRVWLSTWFMLTAITMVTARSLIYASMRRLRLKGRNHKRVVLVGESDVARFMLRRIQSSPWAGFDIIALFDDLAQKPHLVEGVPRKNNLLELARYVIEQDIAEVWITLPLKDEARVRQVLHLLRHTTVNIRYAPDIFAFRLINHGVSEVAGMPMLDLSTTPMTGMNRLVKAVEDRLISLLILAIISPVMIGLAIGVKLTSPGPVFYRQERVGWNGKPFLMLKFRSMPVDTEKNGVQWGNAQAKTNTWFGAFIRRTSLDELPQFLNVLKGDMSIVGPRPERTIFVEQFKDEIPDYMKKHLVKAGITGWAQINGWRGDTDLAKRIEYDLYYIEHWSLWFDLKIIFLTVFKGFVNQNAR